ncbi:MAG: molybdopterin biosynthesis protein [Clostridiales bacterium]|nr:molybdopterin biosynthesis protein [Clostridiales bacterium]
MRKNNVYITNIPLENALETYLSAISNPVTSEMVGTQGAVFRKTSKAIFAKRSSPNDNCAAMDGIAVIAEQTHGATERNPLTLKPGVDFEYVNTGNLMPKGKDAVIMIEDIAPQDDGSVEIIEAAYSWQHVRQVGEDIISGEMILPGMHKIRPLDLGALLSGGIGEVPVLKKLKVGILPTGNEIVQSIKLLEKGKIIDSNSRVIEGLLLELGCEPTVYPTALDDKAVLTEAIQKGIEENDFFITIAGSSAGSKDFTVHIIEELGEVVIHGVAIKPGKPTILGKIDGKGIIGLPGYPVSAFFAFEKFVKPLIETWYRLPKSHSKVEATLTQRIVSSVKNEELIRVTLGKVDGRWIATPLNRGAGATMSLVRADGILTIPRLSEGIESGDTVTIELMKHLEDIEQRLVVIGSHDILIDIIADEMPLSSAHVGSFGGLMAMRKKECHIAPIHLIDEITGIYNISSVQKMFPTGGMSLIKGASRLQGLMVKKGNPKGINEFADLTREDIVFVNRQRGAGTRQLLDFELKKRNIPTGDIEVYHREMTTHMAVAVAVLSEGTDVGLGIYSAAETMGLDFIPVGYESYDFLVRNESLEEPGVKHFIEVLQSEEFRNKLREIGGYISEQSGDIIQIGAQDD